MARPFFARVGATGGTAFDPNVVKTPAGGHRRSVLDDLSDPSEASQPQP